MTNREKYAEQILNIACSGNSIALPIETMEPVSCDSLECGFCYFNKKDIFNNCNFLCEEWCNAEYIEPPVDWSKVPVDTPVLVRNTENAIWHKGHFARVIADKIYAWVNGKTSWTTNAVVRWNYAKLAEESETE